MRRLVGWSVGRLVVTAAVISFLSDYSTNRLTDLLGSPSPPRLLPLRPISNNHGSASRRSGRARAAERQQSRLQGQLQDVTTELQNLERQRDITNRLVR
jgi:hypothetical protein